MTGLEPWLIYWGYRAIKALVEKNKTPSYSPRPPPPETAKRVVTLVGRASTGKSSLGNAVLGWAAFKTGVEHGTTAAVSESAHADGYVLKDTPGVLDAVDHTPVIWPVLRGSGVVVYTTPGQLYRQELEIVERIHNSQRSWDAANATLNRRKLVVFVNFGDRKENTMPEEEREKEAAAVRAQVSSWVSPSFILFGAASPHDGKKALPPDVENLKQLLRSEFSSL